jgi:hypothetical protein
MTLRLAYSVRLNDSPKTTPRYNAHLKTPAISLTPLERLRVRRPDLAAIADRIIDRYLEDAE